MFERRGSAPGFLAFAVEPGRAVASPRRQIGIVRQDVFLFAGSIAETIAYARLYSASNAA